MNRRRDCLSSPFQPNDGPEVSFLESSSPRGKIPPGETRKHTVNESGRAPQRSRVRAASYLHSSSTGKDICVWIWTLTSRGRFYFLSCRNVAGVFNLLQLYPRWCCHFQLFLLGWDIITPVRVHYPRCTAMACRHICNKVYLWVGFQPFHRATWKAKEISRISRKGRQVNSRLNILLGWIWGRQRSCLLMRPPVEIIPFSRSHAWAELCFPTNVLN